MKVFARTAIVVLMATVLIRAQQPPATTNVVPTILSFDTPYGGAGSNSANSFTIGGTGFSTVPHQTRFIDAAGNDVFQGVSCSIATSCTAGLRPGLMGAGSSGYILVRAFTQAGGASASGINFYYYGPPITALNPNFGPYDAATNYSILGGPFTTGVSPTLGTTSVYLFISTFDGNCGAMNVTSCAQTALSLTNDCCTAQGAHLVDIRTPGGNAGPYFLYGNTPNTPTITSVNPSAGPSNGGNTITITGTNFIPGTNSSDATFGVTLGTSFTFVTRTAGNYSSGPVNCSSTTQCSVVVPGTGPGYITDIQVQTVCGINSSAAGCGGNNPRPSMSAITTRKAAYRYAGMTTNPMPGLYGLQPYLYASESGASASYTVSLTAQPTAPVHVSLTVVQAGHGTVSPANGLDFSAANWSVPQTVTVTGLDTGANSDQFFYVYMTTASTDPAYSGLATASPNILNVTSHSKELFLSPQAGLVTTRSGGTASFTVALTQAPSATVTMNLTSSDTSLGTLSTSSLTFDTSSGGGTSWNTPRTVTITGQSDAQVGTPRPYSVYMTLSSADTTYGDPTKNWPEIAVTNQDAAPNITANPSNLSVNAGSLASFTASAVGTPAATVQWQVSSANAPFVDIAGATSGTYAFTAGNADNGKSFRAVFTNTGGTTATTAGTLIINNAPPAISLQPPASAVVLTGNLVFWSANAVGNPLPTAQWQVSTNGGASWNNINGATNTNFAFDAERADNGKQYRVVFTNTAGSTTTIATSLVVRLRVRADYDNDRKSDLVVWRPGSGMWFWLTSSSSYNYASFMQKQWGGSGDITLSADMDGDGMADLVIWRPSNGYFYWLTSSTGYNYANAQQVQWGNSGLNDVPFVADIDGDGKGDLIVWRPSSGTWFYLLSTFTYNYANAGQTQWGNSGLGDVPILGDFDGDGLADFTVWRASTGTWFWLKSSTSYDVNQAGQSQFGNNAFGDIPMVADMDGDGISDLVVWRPTDGNFYWLKSSLNYNPGAPGVKQWGSGANNDMPMLGDIDGDGIADLIIWRPANGTWYCLRSTSGYSYGTALNIQWGSSANSDVPMMKGGIY